MFASALNPVISRALINALLDFVTSTTPPAFTGLIVDLYTSSSAPLGLDMTVGQFTPPVYTGYTSNPISSLSNPGSNSPSGNGLIVYTNQAWALTAAPVSTIQILGYYVHSNFPTVDTVMWAEAFVNPIPLQNVGDFLDLELIFPILSEVPTGA